MKYNVYNLGRFEENRCTALTAFMLLNNMFVCACDRERAVIFSPDSEPSQDENQNMNVSFPHRNQGGGSLLFAGVIQPEVTFSSANKDLDQILLLQHSSYGLIGLSMQEIVERCSSASSSAAGSDTSSVSSPAFSSTASSGAFSLTEDDIALRMISGVHNPAHFSKDYSAYAIRSDRLFYAAISPPSREQQGNRSVGVLEVGEISVKYSPLMAALLTGITSSTPPPFHRPGPHSRGYFTVTVKISEQYQLKSFAADQVGNIDAIGAAGSMETVSSLEIELVSGTPRFYVGTNMGNIYCAAPSFGSAEKRLAEEKNAETETANHIFALDDWQSPLRMISNIHITSYNGKKVIVFNMRQSKGLDDSNASPIYLVELNGAERPEGSSESGTVNSSMPNATVLYINFMPAWFRFDGHHLYSLSGRRASIHDVSADAKRQRQHNGYGLSYDAGRDIHSFHADEKHLFGTHIYPYLGLIMQNNTNLTDRNRGRNKW